MRQRAKAHGASCPARFYFFGGSIKGGSINYRPFTILQLNHHRIVVGRQAMYILTEVQLPRRNAFLAYLTAVSLSPIAIGQNAILVHLELVGNKNVVDATVCHQGRVETLERSILGKAHSGGGV